MVPKIKAMLEKAKHPSNISKLLDRLQENLSRSRSTMGKEYSRWKRNLMTYKGEVPKDQGDQEAAEMGEPERFMVPLTFAQVQTFVAFCFLLLQQNRRFYEFEQVGDEDNEVQKLAEDLLHGDLQENRWPSKLYQVLLDVARMGIGITKEVWARQTVWVPQSENMLSVNGIEGQELLELLPLGDQEIVKFEGNQIHNISPFKFFPDTSLPLSRWREGQFVVDEEEYKYNYMKELGRRGVIAGVEWIEKMSPTVWDKREKTNNFTMLEQEFKQGINKEHEDNFVVVLAEHYVRLVPKEYELGPEDYELLYLVRVVNDERIVSIERYGYVHDEYPHNVGLLSPDTCENLSASLCDTIHSIQEVVTYLVNARVLSLRKSLSRNLIVNPNVIDMESIRNDLDVITTVQGAPTNGLERYAMQLQYRDNTASNLSDADQLQRIMLMVTGVNENAMGQFSPGRRSATENRAANGGAASRMKVIASLLWTDMFAPQGRKMVCNLRYGLSFESFQKYVGQRDNIEVLYEMFCPADPAALVGSRDLFTFDNTVPSEKGFLAQSMQELLIAILQNPQTAPLYDTDSLMAEIYALRGVSVRRFKLPQLPPAQLEGGAVAGAPGVAQVPGGQVTP